MSKEILVTIDGKEYSTEPGKTIIELCSANGIYIPHFCYHKNLSVAGNCRMCLVRVEKMPKPIIACASMVSDGMIIDTASSSVLKLREAVMEFLLINHPLDCPVCDKAGECTLQNYSYSYGRDLGRFEADKVVKEVKDFGVNVKYWGSRCIVCTRCVRFTNEVSGTKELSVVYRGDKSSIDIYKDITLDNPLSMNVNDLCPVGALVSSDFLYEARVWNLSLKDSICISCSVGCNIRVDSEHNRIKRIVPRENQDINKSFVCDYGRLNFNYVYSDNRIKRPLVRGNKASWSEALALFKDKIEHYNKSSLALIVSSWNSVETLYLIKKLKEDYLQDSLVFFYSKKKEAEQVFPGFRISGDRNPNANGIKAIFGSKTKIEEGLNSLSKIQNKIENIIFIGGTDTGYIPVALSLIKDKLEDIIAIDYSSSAFYSDALLLLPSLTYFESSGTYINDKMMAQKTLPVIEPQTFGMSSEDILKDLLALLTGKLSEDIGKEIEDNLYSLLGK